MPIKKCIFIVFLIENICLISCRYSFNLKKRIKNKAHVEASICEAYIVEKISTFISYYFEPHLKTRINRVPRHDDDGEVPLSENLSIFKKNILKNIGRVKRHITMMFVLRDRFLVSLKLTIMGN